MVDTRNSRTRAYMGGMNRRQFVQSLAATLALPVTSPLAVTSANMSASVAAGVPKQARFWAIYISALHGECTPKTLQNLLHIPEVDAKRYIGQLVADGVIKPSALLQNSVSKILKSNETGLLENTPDRLEMKASSQSGDAEFSSDHEDATEATMDVELGEDSVEELAEVETEIDHDDPDLTQPEESEDPETHAENQLR
ncbi:MAG: hypothetical protein AAF035_08315 [Pseudomonadota bacterium]